MLKYMARSITKDETISNVYYDLESAFGSFNETLKKAKEQDPTINIVNVKGFLAKQPNNHFRKYMERSIIISILYIYIIIDLRFFKYFLSWIWGLRYVEVLVSGIGYQR